MDGEEIKEKPVGRSGVLAKWKKENPEGGEPTDDQLWERASSEYDGLKDSHKKIMDGQKGLHDYVSKDPRFGAAINMSFGEGDNKIPFTRSLGRLYGSDAFNDDEEFQKGVEEYNANLSASQKEAEEATKNFEESMKRFEKYVSANSINEEDSKKLYEGIMEFAEAILTGNISEEVFDTVRKGQTRDRDVQEAADTGFVEGKNESARIEMNKKIGPQVPSGNSGSRSSEPALPKRGFQNESSSVYDNMKDIESSPRRRRF